MSGHHEWHPPDVNVLMRKWPDAGKTKLEKLRDAFMMFDKDNSGTIDIGEFQYVMAAAHGKTNAKVPFPETPRQKRLKKRAPDRFCCVTDAVEHDGARGH